MSRNWPIVKLGEVLTPVSRPVVVDPIAIYHLLGAHWYAKGLYTKDVVPGSEIQAKRVYKVEQGDFVYNRLFGWKGSFAIATEENDGCYVSNEFPCFAVNPGRADGKYVWRYFNLSSVWDKVLSLSAGGTPTSRNRLKEEQLLAMDIPLPPVARQKKIVTRIEDLAAKVQEARDIREQAEEEGEALLAASSLAIFSGAGVLTTIGEVCDVIDPNPSHRYPVYVPDGIPIVSSSEFAGEDGIDASLAKRVPESFYEATLGRYDVGAGDVVFSRKGKVGYARLHPEGMRLAMTHTLCVMKPDRIKLEPRYLLHFARSPIFLDELTETMNPNVGVPTLGLGVIRDACIPLPSLPEQRWIIAHLDDLQERTDALKALQAETSAELEALMPSFLDGAFRGEL